VVADVGPVAVTERASGLIVIVADAVAVLAGLAESVPITVMVYVPFVL
jgi:hypothetical protein